MKKIFIVFCMLILSCVAFGQQAMQKTRSENNNDVPLFDGAPPRGEPLIKYILSQFRYPEGDTIVGSFVVVIKFAIDVDGSVVDTEIMKNLHPSHQSHPFLDNEVLRVFNSMPKWTPAFNQGKPVKTQVMYPVYYRYPQ